MMNRIKEFLSQHKKISIIAVSTLLALVMTVGGVIAWLSSSANAKNSFTSAKVTTEISETFNGITKKKVCVENTGTMAAYIRVKLVANWLDSDGNVVAFPASVDDLTCSLDATTIAKNGWFESDGYYYYKNMVPAGEKTANLIASAKVKTNSEGLKKGYTFNLNVLSEGIQGTPESAVNNEWNQAVENGSLSGEAFK